MKQNCSGLLYFKPCGGQYADISNLLSVSRVLSLKNTNPIKNDLIFKILLMNFLHTESLEMIISFMTVIFVH